MGSSVDLRSRRHEGPLYLPNRSGILASSRVSSVTMHGSWLASTWAFVRGHLPDAPATVIEIGCGPDGGFVPQLLEAGYDAVGVDPEAPDGPDYHRIEFERYDATRKADAVVACTSLHHVADVAEVLDEVTGCLAPDGRLVVVEWDWERFDEPTSQWCFGRLAEVDGGLAQHSWLRTIRDEWTASRQPWPQYWPSWAAREGLHTGQLILDQLNARYRCQSSTRTPYFFPDLEETTEADEQAAIDAGLIRAGGIRFVGYPKDANATT
jgi:SAM-dependent methyltransferase